MLIVSGSLGAWAFAYVSIWYRDALSVYMEEMGASSPGVMSLTTYLSKPFQQIERYSSLLKELERHSEVSVGNFLMGEFPSGFWVLLYFPLFSSFLLSSIWFFSFSGHLYAFLFFQLVVRWMESGHQISNCCDIFSDVQGDSVFQWKIKTTCACTKVLLFTIVWCGSHLIENHACLALVSIHSLLMASGTEGKEKWNGFVYCIIILSHVQSAGCTTFTGYVYMFTTRPLLRDHITLPIIYTLAIFNEVIIPIVNAVML